MQCSRVPYLILLNELILESPGNSSVVPTLVAQRRSSDLQEDSGCVPLGVACPSAHWVQILQTQNHTSTPPVPFIAALMLIDSRYSGVLGGSWGVWYALNQS